jgi:hypothetical protein
MLSDGLVFRKKCRLVLVNESETSYFALESLIACSALDYFCDLNESSHDLP